MTVQKENDMGEPGVVEPRTRAGRSLGGRLWGTQATDANQIGKITAGIFRDIRAIEDEARAAALDAVEEAVKGLPVTDQGERCPSDWLCRNPLPGSPGYSSLLRSHRTPADRDADLAAHYRIRTLALDGLLAAIANLRSDGEAR